MNVPPIMKKPAFIGGAVVLFLFVLFMLNRGASSGSGGTQYVDAGPSPAQLQAQTALALAQIDAGKVAGQTAAQVAIAREQLATDLAKGSLQADLSKYLADKQAATDTLNLTVNANIAAANTAAQVATTKYLGDLTAQTTKFQLDQAERIQANNNAFQLDFAEQAYASQTQQALIAANLTQSQIAANRDVTLSVLTAEQSRELARITAARDVELSSIKAGVDMATIQAQTAAAKDAAIISSLPLLKKKNRDDVLKSYVTGEYGYAGPPVNRLAQTIGAIGGAAGNIGKLFF